MTEDEFIDMNQPNRCHTCDEPCEWACEYCGEDVCEDCLMPFTQLNQIDYNLCRNCNDNYENERAEEMIDIEKLELLMTAYGIEEGIKKHYRHKLIISILEYEIKKSPH